MLRPTDSLPGNGGIKGSFSWSGPSLAFQTEQTAPGGRALAQGQADTGMQPVYQTAPCPKQDVGGLGNKQYANELPRDPAPSPTGPSSGCWQWPPWNRERRERKCPELTLGQPDSSPQETHHKERNSKPLLPPKKTILKIGF